MTTDASPATAVVHFQGLRVRPIDHGTIALEIEQHGTTIVLVYAVTDNLDAAVEGATRLGEGAHRIIELLRIRRGDRHPFVAPLHDQRPPRHGHPDSATPNNGQPDHQQGMP